MLLLLHNESCSATISFISRGNFRKKNATVHSVYGNEKAAPDFRMELGRERSPTVKETVYFAGRGMVSENSFFLAR